MKNDFDSHMFFIYVLIAILLYFCMQDADGDASPLHEVPNQVVLK